MTAFRFSTRTPRAKVAEPTFGDAFQEDTPAAEEPGYIQGQKARSILEWWGYLALLKLKVQRFAYQYPLNGGTMRRGGIVLDFVIFDGALIILEFQGGRWHKGQFGDDDRRREAIIRNKFGILPTYIWEHECPDEYSTYVAVRNAVNG